MASLDQITAELNRRRQKERGAGYTANQMARALSHGMSLGYSDEIAAGGDAVIAKLTGDKRPIGDIYGANLQRERALLDEFESESPWVAYPAQVGGAVATGVVTAPALTARLGGGLLGAALTGAAEGGVAGFGVGEGGLVPRLKSAGRGAGLGGAVGAGTSLALKGGKAALNAVNRDGPTRAAALRLREATDDVTPDMLINRLRASDKPLMPADVGGRRLLDLADTVAQGRTKTGAHVQTHLNNRQMAQTARLAKDIGKLAPDEYWSRPIDDLMGEWRAVNLYRDLPMDDVIENADGVLSVLSERPIYQKAFAKAAKAGADFAENIRNPFDDGVTLRAVDEIKKQLDDMIGAAKRAGAGNRVRQLTQAKNDLVSSVDSLDPRYAAARGKWATEQGMKEAAEQGEKYARMSGDEIAAFMKNASDEEKALFRAGAIREIRNVAEGVADGGDAIKRVAGSSAKRGKLRAIFGKDINKIYKNVIDEARMYRTRATVTGNSKTSARQAGQRQLSMDVIGDVAIDAATGADNGASVLRALTSVFRQKQPTLEPEVAEKLARLLFEKNKGRAIKLLQEFDRTGNLAAMAENVASPKTAGVITGAASAPGGLLSGRGTPR